VAQIKRELQRRSQIALGVAVICGVFLLETSFAHRKMPSPASPYVWAGLGLMAVLALGYGLWCRQRARHTEDEA
jgi:drug/metabolite transporter (DMT)-like permease